MGKDDIRKVLHGRYFLVFLFQKDQILFLAALHSSLNNIFKGHSWLPYLFLFVFIYFKYIYIYFQFYLGLSIRKRTYVSVM